MSWWSRRDPRWTSVGLWAHDAVMVVEVAPLTGLDDPAVAEAADVLARRTVR